MKEKLNKNCYIWSIIKYKPFFYMVTIVLNLLIGFMPLIEGIVIKEFFDSISGKTSMFYPYQLIILIAVISLLNILLMRMYFKKSSIHNFYISTLLRRNMLNLILKKHGGNAITSPIGQIINSFREDVYQIETSVYWLSTLIGQIMRAIGAVVILLFINAKITLIIFIPLVLIIRLVQKSEKNIEENREEGRRTTGAVNSAIGEIFESILSIKVSGTKKYLMNNLKVLNKKRNKAMVKDEMITYIINSIYNNIMNIGTGVILLLGAGAISKGSFTVGDFSIFVYYLVYITDSIESFGNFSVYFKQTNVGYKNILNQLNIQQNEESLVEYKNIYLDKYDKEKILLKNNLGNLSSDNELRTLEVKNLTYIYNNSQKGIKDISFKLSKDEILAICGRTGSGKTTLLKSLIGLLPKEQGEIYWNGEKVEDRKRFFTPPISSYTSQVPNLFSNTIRNNILLGLSEKDVDLNEAIKVSVFEKDLKELDNGLDTVIGTRGAKLSGGQMQRVAVARMFARKSQLFVFDDISSALDIKTENLLWTRLLTNDSISCIVVSNRRAMLEKADRIIVLKDGRIESQGTLNELLEDSAELKEVIS